MSGPGPLAAARPRTSRSTGRAPWVAGAAAAVALCLGGQGLLVPAGPSSTAVRVVGAVVALAALAVLVRLDGPAQGTRTLAVVAVAGALTALATLPASPVRLDRAVPAPEERRADAEDGLGTVVLDQLDPPSGATAPLAAPPGAGLSIDGGSVVADLPDGSRQVLGPAADGTRIDQGGRAVVVAGGVLLEVPDPVPGSEDVGPPGVSDGIEALLALLLGAFALLAFAPPVVRVARTVAPPPAPATEPAPSPPGTGRVEDGLADVLRAMLADPDPRTAVIGAYARLLVALGEAGMPRRAEEGPHEHLWRALAPLGVRRSPVHRLAELFVLARFTPHPVDEGHRRAAISALADAVADLRLGAPDPAAETGRVR